MGMATRMDGVCRIYYYHYYRRSRLTAWKEGEAWMRSNRVASSWSAGGRMTGAGCGRKMGLRLGGEDGDEGREGCPCESGFELESAQVKIRIEMVWLVKKELGGWGAGVEATESCRAKGGASRKKGETHRGAEHYRVVQKTGGLWVEKFEIWATSRRPMTGQIGSLSCAFSASHQERQLHLVLRGRGRSGAENMRSTFF